MTEEFTLSADGIQVARDDFQIARVLDLLFFGKNVLGMAYTTAQACAEVGVPTTTWYRWAKEGVLDKHKLNLSAKMTAAIHETIIPQYTEIFQNLVQLAMGQQPLTSYRPVEIKAGDMIRATKLLLTIVPIAPMSLPVEEPGQDAADFLAKAEFKQIFVQGDLNFIYNGNGQPQFGKLEKGENDEDIIDVEPQ